MAEREYVKGSNSTEEKPVKLSLILSVLEALKKSSVCEIAKKMHVQIPGFRLNKAPKKRLIEGIASRIYSKPFSEVLNYINEAIFKEYPQLFVALTGSEEDFDIDYWVLTCGREIVYFVLHISSGNDHEKLLEALEQNTETKKHLQEIKKDIEREKPGALSKAKKDAKGEHELEGLETKALIAEVKQLRRAIAEKDRVISAQNKELKKAEKKLKEERSSSGKRSNEIGRLRKDIHSLKQALTKADQEKASLRNQVVELKTQKKQHEATVDTLDRIITKHEKTASLHGQDVEKFLDEKRRLHLEAVKWEAKWQIERLLRSKSSQKRAIEMKVLIDPNDLQTTYLDAIRVAENRLVEDFSSLNLERRKTTLDRIKTFISLEELVENVALKDEAFLPVNIEIDPDRCTEQVVVEGLFIYEGPHGYLRSEEGLFLVTPFDVVRNNLVTGDRLRLILERTFAAASDIGIQLEVLEKTESKETICSLKKNGDEILVINPFNYSLELSQTEFEYIGYNLDDPVTVIYPDLKVAKIPRDMVIYARVIKAHDPTWQEMPGKERKRSEKKRLTMGSDEEETNTPLYADQTVLVVGGESCKEQLKTIVESMSGNFLFQSGFDCKKMVESNVKKADLAILMTQEISHSVQKLVLKAADKHQKPYHYYNERGAVLFKEFLSDLRGE